MQTNNLLKLMAYSAALFCAMPASHAAEDDRDLEPFEAVNFSLPYSVEFVAADRHYIEFDGDEDVIDDIKTRIKGDTLKVYKDSGGWFNWSEGNVVVTIGYVDLNSINLSGSGDGFAELIETADLTLRITGSANMEMEAVVADTVSISIAGSGNVEIHQLDADQVTSKIAGSGDIELSGRAVEQEISIAGSGDLEAAELRTQETTAKVRGSGDIRVWAASRLGASVMGSGDVYYYGDPQSVKESVHGSGDVVHLGAAP